MKKNLALLRKSLIAALFCVLSIVLVLAFAACNNDSGKPDEEEGVEDEVGVAVLSGGTYWTEKLVESSEMGAFNYIVHVTLDAEENTYYYECHYVRGDATYYNIETGSYTDDGETLVLQPDGADEDGYISATIEEGSFTLTRNLTGMGKNAYEVTFEKGSAPIYVTYKIDSTEFVKIGYKNATDEVKVIGDYPVAPTIYGCTFNSWKSVPATAGTGATVQADYTDGSVYEVDVEWMASAGASMTMSPVLVIGSNDKFGIYNGADRGVCKGWGTVSEEEGVYTLTYADTFANHKDQTTTYTQDGDTITFTSKLFYGVASLNQTDDDGEFVPYTATLKTVEEEGTQEGLVSGNYSVDISGSPMAGMMFPVIAIDAEENTFNVYNASAPEASKAAGTISYADGVYTLTYTDGEQYEKHEGQATTITYDAATKTITFTSMLYYGAATLNITDDDGKFVPYDATLIVE